MINRKDITDFFDISNQENEEKAQALSSLGIEDKVKERKAIINLTLDSGYRDVNDDGNVRLLHCSDNQSDFKEGESVVLCVQNSGNEVCQCNIGGFHENGDVEIVINDFIFNSIIDTYTSVPLMLIKQEVSMEKFYRDFSCCPDFFREDYFEKHLINTRPKPSIAEYSQSDLSANREAVSCMFGSGLNDAQNIASMNAERTTDYYLVQGPPGTGKSFISAIRLFDEIMCGHKVVLVGPTHMAVNNALIKLAELLVKRYEKGYENAINNVIFKCGQSYNAKSLVVKGRDGEDIKIRNVQYLNTSAFNVWCNADGEKIEHGWVIGMTPYALQSRRARGLEFDTLFIDEAGQMTIPVAWMAMVKPHKVIMFGDHKQLPPIISPNIEHEDLQHSIFSHFCRPDNSTMLNVSYRMNDAICRLVSDLFYDGKLLPFDGSKRLMSLIEDVLYSGNHPVVFQNCASDGKHTSIAEAQKAIEIIVKYVVSGVQPSEIAVLAPFRAQCALLRKLLASDERLSLDQRQSIVIDTVDRMQGQEREIIIYSFTSGDIEYMCEMSEFLYNPQKLNVAFSRAKNKLILLGNMDSIRRLGNDLVNNVLSHKSVEILT